MSKVHVPEPEEVRKELAATVRRADFLRRLLRLHLLRRELQQLFCQILL